MITFEMLLTVSINGDLLTSRGCWLVENFSLVFPAIGLLSELEELPELDGFGLSGGDSGGEGG